MNNPSLPPTYHHGVLELVEGRVKRDVAAGGVRGKVGAAHSYSARRDAPPPEPRRALCALALRALGDTRSLAFELGAGGW